MNRQFCIALLVATCFIAGCKAGFMSTLVAPQEWSENYALLEGATCSVSAMADGNLETVGTANQHWIIITLPTRKPIHRIVIRGTNIEDLIIYESVGGEGEWKRIDKINNNRKSTIDLRVSVVTDGIRFKIGETSDDQRLAGDFSYQVNRIRNRQVKRGYPTAQEIELYGFVQKKTSNDD